VAAVVLAAGVVAAGTGTSTARGVKTATGGAAAGVLRAMRVLAVGVCDVGGVREHAKPITASEPARMTQGVIAERPARTRFFFLRGTIREVRVALRGSLFSM
jgi:hypothetical protein